MWSQRELRDVAAAVGDAFLGGDWTREGLLARGELVLGGRPRWLAPLAVRALDVYRDRPGDRRLELAEFLAHELPGLRLTVRAPRVRHRLPAQQAMGRQRWPVPEIATVADLAAFLDLHLGELLHLADARGWERRAAEERPRNYRYAWAPRPSGPPRLLERPKELLKESQRRVLHQILDAVPPHEAAHGFRRGHSVLTHARRHVGARVVLRFDLRDFFASVDRGRVYGVFRGAGYPETVAFQLAALCTNVVPRAVWDERPDGTWGALGAQLRTPHLPQGAPTSPAVANLCAFGLDRRLAGLAASLGATYSRYADDLALSGGGLLAARAPELRTLVARIVREEGFAVNERKSQLLTRAGRQQLTGVVVNERPNVPRRDYDRLKATLHNASRRGPGDLRRDRLLGQVAWVEQLNPQRGAKLRRLFEAVDWVG
jgi:hypothetical protein